MNSQHISVADRRIKRQQKESELDNNRNLLIRKLNNCNHIQTEESQLAMRDALIFLLKTWKIK